MTVEQLLDKAKRASRRCGVPFSITYDPGRQCWYATIAHYKTTSWRYDHIYLSRVLRAVIERLVK